MFIRKILFPFLYLISLESHSLSKMPQDTDDSLNPRKELLNDDNLINDFHSLAEYKQDFDLSFKNLYKNAREEEKEDIIRRKFILKKILIYLEAQKENFIPIILGNKWNQFETDDDPYLNRNGIVRRLKAFFEDQRERKNIFLPFEKEFTKEKTKDAWDQYLFYVFSQSYCQKFIDVEAEEYNDASGAVTMKLDLENLKNLFNRLEAKKIDRESFLYYFFLPSNLLRYVYKFLKTVITIYMNNKKICDSQTYFRYQTDHSEYNTKNDAKYLFYIRLLPAYIPIILKKKTEIELFLTKISSLYENIIEEQYIYELILNPNIYKYSDSKEKKMRLKIESYHNEYKEISYSFNNEEYINYIDINRYEIEALALAIYKIEQSDLYKLEFESEEEEAKEIIRKKIYNNILSTLKQIWDLQEHLKSLSIIIDNILSIYKEKEKDPNWDKVEATDMSLKYFKMIPNIDF